MISVRAIDLAKDYDMLRKWWQVWGCQVIPKERLPATGFIAKFEQRSVVAAFFVMTNAWYAFITTFVSDFNSTPEERELCIKALLDHATDFALEFGYNKLIVLPQKPWLKDKIEKAGFYVDPTPTFLCLKEF